MDTHSLEVQWLLAVVAGSRLADWGWVQYGLGYSDSTHYWLVVVMMIDHLESVLQPVSDPAMQCMCNEGMERGGMSLGELACIIKHQ